MSQVTDRVFLGGLSTEDVDLVKTYLDKFLPKAQIEILSNIGIRGKIKNQGKGSDVALIILDTALYNTCVGAADEVLSLPKCLKCEDNFVLKKFLNDRFGVDGSVVGTTEPTTISLDSNDDGTDSQTIPSNLQSLIHNLEMRDKSNLATISNLRNHIRELSLDNEDLNVYIDKINMLEAQLQDLQNSKGIKNARGKSDNQTLLASLETQLSNLNIELDKMSQEYQSVSAELSAYKDGDKLSGKTEIEINSMKTEILSLKSDLEESQEVISNLKEQVANLDAIRLDLSNRNVDLTASDERKLELEAKLETLKESLDVSESSKQELQLAIDNLVAERSRLQDQLATSEDIVKTLTDELSRTSGVDEETENNGIELSKANSKIEQLNSRIAELDSIISEKDILISDLGLKARNLGNELELEQNKFQEVKIELSKSKSRLEILEEKDFEGISAERDSLQIQLDESEDNLAKLRKEYSLSIADVSRLRDKLKESETALIKLVDLEKLQGQVKVLQDELDYHVDFVQDIKSSPLFLMNNYSGPKVTMPLSLDVDVKFVKSKLVLLSTGNGETAYSMYSSIKEQCEKSNQTFLLVDLVTESYIDTVIGLKAKTNAVTWVSGEDVTSCIVDTNIPNVTALSTAISYFNDLALLNVNWSRQLKLLDGLADVILFNIGCLDSVVRLTMFNTLLGVCSLSNIFVKASPTGLRTAINHLSSIGNIGISKVICTDCDNIESQLLRKLSQKYDVEIYQEGISLGW